jgi:hypothetical protein
VSHESNEPIVEWTDNKSLMIGAFPDKVLFGQGVPIWMCTMKNSKGSSAVAKENSRGEQQQPRQFVLRWSTTKIIT